MHQKPVFNLHLRTVWMLLLSFTILSIATVLWVPHIPQDLNYHNFSDTRNFFGITNFNNVASNLLLVLAGIIGLSQLAKATFINSIERWPYVGIFIGAVLTGIGSSLYHLAPDNATLVWDRLPLTIISMSYFSAILMERINTKLGVYLLIPLILIGLSSVLFWYYTESMGRGDLRFYGWAQFYPFVMVILMLLLLPSPYSATCYIWLSLGWYVIAKTGEFSDNGIYSITAHIISGHTIKHLAAAMAIFSIVGYLKYRKPIQ